jgi:hypothetical protein
MTLPATTPVPATQEPEERPRLIREPALLDSVLLLVSSATRLNSTTHG